MNLVLPLPSQGVGDPNGSPSRSVAVCQVALYFDGRLRVSWSSVRAAAPFVGVSAGTRPSLHLEKGDSALVVGVGIGSAGGK